MIIFDTNAVNLLQPEGPTADIIRKLRQSGHHRVAVPWMVLEEMAAHQARYYPDKHRTVLNSLEKLQAVLPWELKSSLEPLDLERFLNHWREAYSEIFEVIETSEASLRRAYQREAMALPPAKRAKDHSEGGRDAAIWFSILEFLEQNPDQHVHFVTNNTNDFGDGTTYRYPMNDDVRGLEDRLTMLKDFAQVVSEFTEEVSGKEAEDAAAQLLASPSVRNGVAEAARALSTLTGYMGLGDGDEPEQWHAWSGTPEVELLAVTDVTGHAIEGDVWYTATARWLLYGLAVDEVEALAGYIACIWETKILFSAGDGMGPTLLTSSEPAPPDTDNEPCMKLLQGLKKQVADIAAAAKRNVLAARTPAERLVSDRLASTLSGLDLTYARLAGQAAEHLRLVNGPAQQFARQMAANRAALNAAINAPGVRLAQQVAQQMAAMPRLDIAVPSLDIALPPLDISGYTHRSRDSGEDGRQEGGEQDGQQGTSAPNTHQAEPDEGTVSGDSSPDE
ncbi:PIN domain-containing protein [Streptomyces sp. NPDC003857]